MKIKSFQALRSPHTSSLPIQIREGKDPTWSLTNVTLGCPLPTPIGPIYHQNTHTFLLMVPGGFPHGHAAAHSPGAWGTEEKWLKGSPSITSAMLQHCHLPLVSSCHSLQWTDHRGQELEPAPGFQKFPFSGAWRGTSCCTISMLHYLIGAAQKAYLGIVTSCLSRWMSKTRYCRCSFQLMMPPKKIRRWW